MITFFILSTSDISMFISPHTYVYRYMYSYFEQLSIHIIHITIYKGDIIPQQFNMHTYSIINL